MRINAILDGNVVTIGNIEVKGNDVWITYTDSSSALFVTKKFIPSNVAPFTPVQICTSAVVVS